MFDLHDSGSVKGGQCWSVSRELLSQNVHRFLWLPYQKGQLSINFPFHCEV